MCVYVCVCVCVTQGYTEPDPRDDLNGTDVARKVAILARECGMHIELSDIPVESLVPEPLRACKTAAEYMAGLPKFDEEMGRRLKEAKDAGEVLRFVGVVDVQVRACVWMCVCVLVHDC